MGAEPGKNKETVNGLHGKTKNRGMHKMLLE